MVNERNEQINETFRRYFSQKLFKVGTLHTTVFGAAIGIYFVE